MKGFRNIFKQLINNLSLKGGEKMVKCKSKWSIFGIALVSLLFFTSSASASLIDISFVGVYSFTDTDVGGDVFNETLSFSPGAILAYNPTTDGIFSDVGLEMVVISNLVLDSSSYVSGSYFDFSPQLYLGGFSILDDDFSMLLTADLTVDQLLVDGATADINSSFSMNLTNITLGGSYVTGTSEIIDSFAIAQAAGYGGATTITLQISGDISAQIIGGVDGSSFGGTYSGTAAPVPEPASLLLLGSGFVGMFFLRRRKKA